MREIEQANPDTLNGILVIRVGPIKKPEFNAYQPHEHYSQRQPK